MYDPNKNRYGDPLNPFTQPPGKSASSMATAAITCAMIAILSVFTVFGAVVFGALAVIFALLSRGERLKFERPAKYALYIGIIAIIISIVMIVFSFIFVSREYGSLENFYKKYLYTIEQNYGVDLNMDGYTDPGTDLYGTGEAL